MKIDTGKLESCISNLNYAIEKLVSAKETLNDIKIPEDYPGYNKSLIESIINELPNKINETKNMGVLMSETISNSIEADEKSLEMANAIFGALSISLSETLSKTTDTTSKVVNEISEKKESVAIKGNSGSASSSNKINNYSNSGSIGNSINSESENKVSIGNNWDIRYETPDIIDDKTSQIKFYDLDTGKQLIKAERVNGKDVFINIETGEIIEELGAGGTSWSNDITYLEEMRKKATEIGSATGWFCIVDRDNFKTTVLVFLDGEWRVIKTYDCGTGRKGIEGHTDSHTFTGIYRIDHKSDHEGPDDWWSCFIPYYKPDGTDFGQGFHEGYTGIPSYQSYGCTRLSTENAQWIYYNVPIETTVLVF